MYKAYLHTGSGRIEVAVKTIRRYEQNEMKNFMREMAVMSQLMHPNIIHLHGIVKQRELCMHAVIHQAKLTLLGTSRPVISTLAA